MEIDDAITTIEEKYKFSFKEKQKEAVKPVLESKDTFVVLPTGYGKTKIFQYLPELFELVSGEKSSVLVVSPLQSLMLDQVARLNNDGIKSTVVGECQKDKSIVENISSGEYPIVFTSPEAALLPGLWRKCFTTGTFHRRLKAVVIDEAHCITEWGGEFRQEYSRLAELRSVLPSDVPFLAMTATSTKSMRTTILENLGMNQDTVVTVYKLPDRSNIKYIVQKSNKNFNQLQWLLQGLLTNGTNAPKTVVYCRNIASCADLFEHFFMHLCDRADFNLIAMFHRSTASKNKDYVLSEFPKADSTIRVVFATVAFGMGVDVPDIETVVHWGAPRGLEQFAQESGRAGRDGRQSLSIVYFSGHDLAKDHSTTEVKDYCKATTCLRTILNNYFRLDNSEDSISTDSCSCCCKCADKCKCGHCLSLECVTDLTSAMLLPVNEDSCRHLNDKQIKMLKANLLDYRECLIEEESDHLDAYDDSLINNIIKNADFLLCVNDIIELGLLSHELADDILILIEEV